MAWMEREMNTLQGDFKSAETSCGDHMLELVVASRYFAKLLRNPQVERYLNEHHGEFLDEFRAIVASNTLEQAAQDACLAAHSTTASRTDTRHL